MSNKLQTSEVHHEEIVKGFYEQMRPVLDKSEQPIFIYLDDNHKACNSKFATMLGYKSSEDWASIEGFLDVFVNEKSQQTLSTAYWNAMNKMVASTIQLTLIKKGGKTLETTMILVPIFFSGHLLSSLCN
jgi:hypothetical protein